MADRILISTEDYRRISRNLQTLSDELSDCAAALGRVALTNDAGGKLRINLSGALRSVSGSMPDGQLQNVVPEMCALVRRLSGYSDQLARATNQASDMFERTERQLAALQMSSSQEAVFSGGGGGAGSGTFNHAGFDWLGDGLELFRKFGKYTPQQIAEYGISAIFDAAGLISIGIGGVNAVSDGNTTAMGSVSESSSWGLGGKKGLYKKSRKTIAEKKNGENPLSDRVSLFDISAGAGVSKSVINVNGQLGDEDRNISGSLDVMKGSLSGNVYGGLGYVNDNGDFKLSPGAGVEVGVSGTVFEGSVSGNYELIDNVSVFGNATASAGKIDAGGDVIIGVVDGKLGLHAGISAEALAGEVAGDVGLNVAGIKGSIGGSLNYGIGGKAELGFKDGKFVYDVGLTVGVGASVYGEVDVSEFAENVYEGAVEVGSNIYEGAMEIGSNVYEGAKEFGSNVYEGAKEFGSNVYEGAQNCGKAITGFCSSAWNYLT